MLHTERRPKLIKHAYEVSDYSRVVAHFDTGDVAGILMSGQDSSRARIASEHTGQTITFIATDTMLEVIIEAAP